MTRTFKCVLAPSLTLVVALAATPAIAGPIDLTNISGTWENSTGGTNVSGEGTNSITWGDGVAPDSGYLFEAALNILNAGIGVPLLMGEFTHFNEVIPVPNLTGVDLHFGFDTNGAPASVSTLFPFAHNETPNNTGTSPADDDIVTITTPIVNVPILVGTDLYFFNLLGFSTDGGVTFQSVFSSPEGGNNSALLFGQLTTEPVPEPASLLLFGGALTAVAARLRRARASSRAVR
jgi:PEP-CTERM motif-containing protein